MKIYTKQFNDLYFIDEDHKQNFLVVCRNWRNSTSKGNEEFLSACYILASPLIFDKLRNAWKSYDYPTDWIWAHEEGKLDLSSGMRQLGLLSRHLFNYEHKFDLMESIGSLDPEYVHVLLEAITIRKFGVNLPPKVDMYV